MLSGSEPPHRAARRDPGDDRCSYQVAGAVRRVVDDWHLILAYVALASLRMAAVFVIVQRRIAGGITSGAVK